MSLVRVRNLDKGLAEIAALQHIQEGLRAVLDSLGDAFAILHATVSDVSRDLFQKGAEPVVVIGDDETADGKALCQNQAPQPGQAVGTFGHGHAHPAEIILADHATDRNASPDIHQRHHAVQRLAADILEIDVDTVRTLGGQGVLHLGPILDRVVIDAGVEPQFVCCEGTLFSPARDADNPQSVDLGKLTDE